MPSKKKAKPTRANVAPPAMPQSKPRNRHPKTEHLKATQFKPGQSGNPGGRPRNILSDAARCRLAQRIPGDKQRRDFAAATVQVLINEGLKGNINAIALLFDRIEGKAMQAHQVSGPGGGAIQVTSLSPEENERRIAELLAKGGMS